MNSLLQSIAAMIVFIPWLAGLVLARGFWSTVFALFPLCAYYLVVERVMQHMGWL